MSSEQFPGDWETKEKTTGQIQYEETDASTEKHTIEGGGKGTNQQTKMYTLSLSLNVFASACFYGHYLAAGTYAVWKIYITYIYIFLLSAIITRFLSSVSNTRQNYTHVTKENVGWTFIFELVHSS